MSFTRIVQIVYVFIRALLADLRLASSAVGRAYLERLVPLIERTLVDKGNSFSVVEVLDDGWMRAYVNGREALISVRFGLVPDDRPSERRVIKAVKRFGMVDVVLSFVIVPPARLLMSKDAFVPRIEKRDAEQ